MRCEKSIPIITVIISNITDISSFLVIVYDEITLLEIWKTVEWQYLKVIDW